MKKFYLVFILITVLTASGFQATCGGNRTQQARSYEEQFAINTSRLAEHTSHGLKLTETLVDTKLISPPLGTAIVDKLLNVNHVNKLLVQSASQFIVIENGVRVLRFTEGSRLDLERLALALSVATKGVTSHPDWIKVDPKARDELSRLIGAMTSTALRIVSLIQGAKRITVANAAYIEVTDGTNTCNRQTGLYRVGIMGQAHAG
jgi:hypothetical protein